MLAEIATGRATPLGPLADQWLEVKSLKPRQRMDYRRGVAKLEAWLADQGAIPYPRGDHAATASDYRDEASSGLVTHPRRRQGPQHPIGALEARESVRPSSTGNPWRGQSSPNQRLIQPRSPVWPVKGSEVDALITPTRCGRLLRDTVALLPCRHKSRGTVNDQGDRPKDLTGALPYVVLRGTKTVAAHREVPYPPRGPPYCPRQGEGKAAGDYLLHELTTPPEGSAMERGQPITKAFGRLRKRLGIDEREPGARQANVDLHSLRRFAIASMRDALNAGATGYSMRTVAQICGHDVGDLGLSMTSMYAGEEPLSAKAAAIGAIRLPTGRM